jgi:hypothetical protein
MRSALLAAMVMGASLLAAAQIPSIPGFQKSRRELQGDAAQKLHPAAPPRRARQQAGGALAGGALRDRRGEELGSRLGAARDRGAARAAGEARRRARRRPGDRADRGGADPADADQLERARKKFAEAEAACGRALAKQEDAVAAHFYLGAMRSTAARRIAHLARAYGDTHDRAALDRLRAD